MADHVTIGGDDYCVTGSGLAVRVTLEQIPGGPILVMTDDVVQATWEIGGTWDAGRNPWFVPTPNPLQVELGTDDPRWDPFHAGFYNPVPLQSIMTVWLAEADTDPAGAWFVARRARGMILGWRVDPEPGGVRRRVILEAVDSTTSMADCPVGERGEEHVHARLTWLISQTAGLASSVSTGLTTPTMGRVHPSQEKNALDHAVDVALAAGHALIFQPFYTANPAIHTLVATVPIAALGAPGATFTASTNPDAGPVDPGPGSHQVPIDTGFPACLDAVTLTKTDDGFRTRIDASREVAYYQSGAQNPAGTIGAGNYSWFAAPHLVDVGDKWTFTYDAGINWTGAPPTLTPATWDGTVFGYGTVRQWNNTGSWWNTSWTWEPPYAYAPPVSIGYWISVPGTAFLPDGKVTVVRAGGAGPSVTYIAPGGNESTNGIRALVGHRSPIARQADLVTWMTTALNWRTTPRKLNASPVTVRSTAGHQSPGTRQWAVHMNPSARVALALNTVDYVAPFPASVAVWVVNIKFTLDPDGITLDVVCAPPSDPY